MAKVQYTKVEDILKEGLRKLSADGLLALADVAAGIGPQKKNPQKIIEQLKAELNFFKIKDPDLIKKLSADPKLIQGILKKIDPITEEEWSQLNPFIEQFNTYKKTLKEAATDEKNESIIESERLKHINKRFNVRDKWLPLH